ncbi:cytochrome P450 [Pyrrhoderma noxium]|uniref:Cytochrome P450 n=1 Tax=Pyrrhoderma noxium TaxID=2282107 RepID=A0A286UIF6_9AGAM|nr:cytochrome P450 [Pyrrhoderma noxium]
MKGSVTLVVLGAAILLYVKNKLKTQSLASLPPGPKGNWIIGNLGVILSKYQWRTYSAWSKIFGDIIYMKALGRPVIILNKFEHARELMEKRSSTYSDRPRMVYIVEMVKIRSVTFMRYGDLWRLHRRLLQQYLNMRAVVAFQPHQAKAAANLLIDLAEEPVNFPDKIKRFSASAVLCSTYGYYVLPKDDPLIALNTHSEGTIIRPGPPGSTLVDLFPFLQYLPSFFPGAKFKKMAEQGKDALYDMATQPYNMVKEQRKAGKAPYSLLSRMLEEYEQSGADDEVRYEAIKDVCASMYRAGVATTNSTLLVFFMAMVLHPEVVKKAQVELDDYLRGERLPAMEDKDKLPYITYIMKECWRWRPPFPLGISHMSMEDDELEGKFIPKGSLIMPNIWHMMHDERNYTNPEEFDPDRFKDPSILDSRAAIFGFGRRICPGRYFAEADIWLAMANILTVFDIKPAVDDQGADILPDPQAFISGLNSWPLPYQCRIVPRNDKSLPLIKQNLAIAAEIEL